MSTHLWVNPAFGEALTKRGLESLDAMMATSAERSLHKRGLATWRERLMVEPSDGLPRLFIKRYVRPPLKEQLKRLLSGGRSTAETEWAWIRALDNLGIAVPPAVACGWDRSFVIERRSVLVTAEIPGGSLERWVAEQNNVTGVAPVVKRAVMRALADITARLHGAGLVHRDLYLAHVFMAPAAGAAPALTLIDLQRVFRPHWRFERWRIKDLAALNYSTPPGAASRADRLRWFKWYLGHSKLGPAERRLIGRVVHKTARIARHSHKHGLG